jgi:hypothetical protein
MPKQLHREHLADPPAGHFKPVRCVFGRPPGAPARNVGVTGRPSALEMRKIQRASARALIGTTLPAGSFVPQYLAHAFISCRRFSNRSLRRYVASTLSGMRCARVASARAHSWSCSAPQYRTLERNLGWHRRGDIPKKGVARSTSAPQQQRPRDIGNTTASGAHHTEVRRRSLKPRANAKT